MYAKSLYAAIIDISSYIMWNILTQDTDLTLDRLLQILLLQWMVSFHFFFGGIYCFPVVMALQP